jgi:hypothetical protein
LIHSHFPCNIPLFQWQLFLPVGQSYSLDILPHAEDMATPKHLYFGKWILILPRMSAFRITTQQKATFYLKWRYVILKLFSVNTIQMTSNFWSFDFMMGQKWDTFSRDHISNLELGYFPGLMICGMILSWDSGSELQPGQPCDHKGKYPLLCSELCC